MQTETHFLPSRISQFRKFNLKFKVYTTKIQEFIFQIYDYDKILKKL